MKALTALQVYKTPCELVKRQFSWLYQHFYMNDSIKTDKTFDVGFARSYEYINDER